MRHINKAIMLAISILCIASYVQAAQFYDMKPSDVVWAKRYGKSYSGLTNAVATIGTRQKTLIVDGGGTWAVTNSVTLPTNITLLVAPDTLMNISTTKILKVSGFIGSGDWQIFSGPGLVTGPCDNAFVYIDWVDATYHTISWLGTPYTSIVAVSTLDSRGYATTNWTTNLVTGTSNSIMSYITNLVHGTSNSIKIWATNEFVEAGGTSTVSDISFTDFPYYGVSLTKSGGWSYKNGARNQHRILTNFTVGFEYNNGWNSANSRFEPPKAGMWMVSLIADIGHQITGTLAQVEGFHCRNGETNGNANLTRMLDKAQDNVFSDDSLVSGSTVFYTPNTGEYWQIYIRSSVTGALNFAYLDYTYMGKTNLVQ